MKIASVCKKITQSNFLIGKWVNWLVLPIFAFLLIDVLMRYLFRHPTIWSAELALLLFGLYAVLPGGYLHSKRLHVRVDIFYDKFSDKTKAWIDILAAILSFLFLGAIVWQGMDMAIDAATIKETSNSMWQAPIWVFKFVVPIGGILFLLQSLVRLIADIRILYGKTNDPEIYGK